MDWHGHDFSIRNSPSHLLSGFALLVGEKPAHCDRAVDYQSHYLRPSSMSSLMVSFFLPGGLSALLARISSIWRNNSNKSTRTELEAGTSFATGWLCFVIVMCSPEATRSRSSGNLGLA